jgi:hypothetical protein
VPRANLPLAPADDRAGFQNSPTGPDLAVYAARSYSLMRPAEDGAALDLLAGQVCDGVVGPGRAELAAAMRSPPVVMGFILGQDRPQMPLAEDEHPVGDLGPGGEHEPFRISVRARAARRDLHDLDTGIG